MSKKWYNGESLNAKYRAFPPAFLLKEIPISINDKNIIGKVSNVRIVDETVIADISFASEDKRRLFESFNI